MTRLLRAWNALEPEQHLAGVAALLMFVAMFLPWYQQNAVVNAAKTQPLVSRNLSAFAVFSFIEAADLLVAVAVLWLLFARAERRSFQLPGGDGTVVLTAGIWTALLLVWRLFDKPGITHNGIAANVGIQWGIFFALAAAGLLIYAGSRMRAARSTEEGGHPIAPAGARGAIATPTPVLAKQPELEPTQDRPRYPPSPSGAVPARGRRSSRRQPNASMDAEQLSFEDSPPDSG